jgi:hypothetical protein
LMVGVGDLVDDGLDITVHLFVMDVVIVVDIVRDHFGPSVPELFVFFLGGLVFEEWRAGPGPSEGVF